MRATLENITGIECHSMTRQWSWGNKSLHGCHCLWQWTLSEILYLNLVEVCYLLSTGAKKSKPRLLSLNDVWVQISYLSSDGQLPFRDLKSGSWKKGKWGFIPEAVISRTQSWQHLLQYPVSRDDRVCVLCSVTELCHPESAVPLRRPWPLC